MDDERPGLPKWVEEKFRSDLLDELKSSHGLPYEELSLFEWYVRETEKLYDQMYAEELKFIEDQDPDRPDYNDSGMVPVAYFIKRSRYSHVIHLASLGETVLSHACWKLTKALGKNIIFGLKEISGQNWTRERKFIERYGNFDIPDELWNRLSQIYLVRNALVHDNGAIDAFTEDDRKKIRKKYADAPGIGVEGYEIQIEPEFVSFGLQTLKEFTAYLTEKLSVVIDWSVKPRSVPLNPV